MSPASQRAISAVTSYSYGIAHPSIDLERASMSGNAVIMLIVAVIIVWGGLAASVVQLRRHPDQPNDPDA